MKVYAKPLLRKDGEILRYIWITKKEQKDMKILNLLASGKEI